MKTTKTYSQLFEFNSASGLYFSKNPDNKISASIKKIAKQLKEHLEEYYDRKDTLQLNNCLTDPTTKAILFDERKVIEKGKEKIIKERLFSPEGTIKLKGEVKLLEKETVELDARIADGIDDLIKELSDEEKECFSGLVIPEQKETETTNERSN